MVYFASFPILQALERDAQIRQHLNHDHIKQRKGICSSPLASLPENVSNKIALFTCSVESTIKLASTCTTLRQDLFAIIDEVALEELKTRYPFMLPMTPSEKRDWQSKVQWAQLAFGSCAAKEFPWLAYMHVCLRPNAWAITNRYHIIMEAPDLSSRILGI